jgi:D-alanine transaminase
MPREAFVDGRYLPFDSAKVHVEDRGLQFSDSVYEVFAVREGRILEMAPHLARLKRSLAEIGQGMPMSDAALGVHVREIVLRNRLADGLVYLQVTRGVSKRDHAFPATAVRQSVIMTARSADPAKAAKSVAAGVAVICVPDIRWGRCDIKSTALLANVLAKQQARTAGAYEAWLVDESGFVTEGSSTNAWIVSEAGALVTRSIRDNILPGVTRAGLLAAIAGEGYTVEERSFSVVEAKKAREAFITAASSFVLPVVTVDSTKIGTGRPGPVTLALRERYLAEAG